MLKVKIRNVFIASFFYAFLGFSIIIGFSVFNLNDRDTKTLSELIALDETNSIVYTILITIYGIIKSLTIAIFLYDYRVFKQMNRQKHYKYGKIQIFLSYLNILTILISMWGMLSIVFVKVTTDYSPHVVIAALTFGNNFASSFFLFIRRFLVHRVEESFLFLSLNSMYLLLMITAAALFLVTLKGYFEWIFIYLLTFEYLFLAHDYDSSTITIDLNFIRDEYL